MLKVVAFTNEPASAAGLSLLLSTGNCCRVAKVYTELTALEAELPGQDAQVVLLDLKPEVTANAILRLRELAPRCRIVLWVHEISPPLAYQAVERGVSGILPKSAPAETLVTCLEVVAKGGLWFQDWLERSGAQAESVALTPREGELVCLVTSGLTNKQIATQMRLSEGTVKVYLCRLYKKLGVDSRFELAIHGLRNGAQTSPVLWPTAKPGGRPDVNWLRSMVVSKGSSGAGARSVAVA